MNYPFKDLFAIPFSKVEHQGSLNVLWNCFPFKQTPCLVKQKILKSSVNVNPVEHEASKQMLLLKAILKWTAVADFLRDTRCFRRACWKYANVSIWNLLFNYAGGLNGNEIKLFWHLSIFRGAPLLMQEDKASGLVDTHPDR